MHVWQNDGQSTTLLKKCCLSITQCACICSNDAVQFHDVQATEYGWYLSILICKYCTSLFSKMCYFFYGIFYWLNVEGIIEILVKGKKFHLTQHLHFGGHHVYLHIFMLHRFTSINLKRHLPHITLLHRWNLDFSVAEKTVLNYKGHYAGFCMKTLLALMLWSGMQNLLKR